MKKRIGSLLLALAIIFSMIPASAVSVAAADTNPVPVITAENVWAASGSTVEVNIDITNNPGILGATLIVSWDEGLTLIGDKNGVAFAGTTYQAPSRYNSGGTNFVWYGSRLTAVQDGTVLTLTFQVSETAKETDVFAVNVTCKSDDVFDQDKNLVNVSTENGSVQVVNYRPGDVTGDDNVNILDLIKLSQFISDGCVTDPDGYNVTINAMAADVNDSGSLNTLDLILISQYISDDCTTDPDGYNIILKPSTPKCSHTMDATAAKDATCTEDGNIAYWYCTSCKKYFSDANGKAEISLEDTVITATGHTVVIDPAVEPTKTTTGLTEGSHCSACNEVFVAQQIVPIPKADEYVITYKPAYNDEYLQTVDFNSQIPDEARTYTAEDGIYELPILEAEGYDFVGWFDGSSSQATKVTAIPSGTKGNKTLYARWEVVDYTITFDSSFITVGSITNHNINKATALPGADTMNLYGYRWLGWSDDDGVLYDGYYPVGKKGNVTLHANWQSYRNQAVPVEKLAEPNVYIDEEAKTYMFTFELGTINNVPLHVINDFGKMIPGQPKVTETVSTTDTISQSEAESIADTISKATTKTSTWTLSNEWNTISSVSESHAQEMGVDISRIDYDFDSSTTEIALTSDAGASKNETVNWGVNAKVYGKNTLETSASAEFPVKCVNIGVGVKNTTEIGGELSGNYDKTTVNDSYWNTSSSYNNSTTAMNSTTTSQNLSQHVSDVYNYSTTSSQGGSESTAEGLATVQSNTNEYATSIAYTTEEIKSTSYVTEYTTEVEGWWRQIIVGKVHVIGVVSYDMATSTYSVYTYNVLDSQTSTYMDFSRTSGDYDDFENGVIPFEIPFSVNEYISYALGYSEGLEIDRNTGVVTGYEGDAEHIHIPDYYTINNGDGTYTAVKVTGLAPGLFANKTNIKSVRLGKYITTIPANTFSGCTALETVEYETLTLIDEKAFENCTSLKKFVVDQSVTTLGTNAFTNAPEVVVYAATSDVVKSAVNSGAKSLSIYLNKLTDELADTVLIVQEPTNTFALYGRDKDSNVVSYSNLRIESNAATTIINGMNFVNNESVPLKFDSENVTLAQVSVQNAPGLALILLADTTSLHLMDQSAVTTVGTAAILSKSIVLDKASGTNTTTSFTANGGSLMYCGTFTDNSNLFVGDKLQISKDVYNQLLTDSLPWVLATEVPEDATVVSEKWTYDLTTNITSNQSFVDGYTLYDTTSAWGDYGAWSSWSKTAVTASDTRQIETKTVTDKAGYTRYKYWIYRSSDHHTYGTQGFNGVCYEYDEIYLSYQLSLVDSANSLYGYYANDCGHSWCNKWFSGGSSWVPAVTHTEYRYRDRQLVYTYYHTKTEAMESATEVAVTDSISNVQKWVQYVAN